MVSHCANPVCHEPFVYFRSGKIFAIPRKSGAAEHATIECFWLCQRCVQNLALEFHQGDHHPALVARHIVRESFQRVEYKL
jgi:hypothetical protein